MSCFLLGRASLPPLWRANLHPSPPLSSSPDPKDFEPIVGDEASEAKMPLDEEEIETQEESLISF